MQFPMNNIEMINKGINRACVVVLPRLSCPLTEKTMMKIWFIDNCHLFVHATRMEICLFKWINKKMSHLTANLFRWRAESKKSGAVGPI